MDAKELILYAAILSRLEKQIRLHRDQSDQKTKTVDKLEEINYAVGLCEAVKIVREVAQGDKAAETEKPV